MVKLGFLIDTRRCIGCRACEAACIVENMVPPGIFWRYVLEWEHGKYPNVTRTFVTMQCMHCENPPCVEACPANALYKNDAGVVLVDYEKCIGCGYCTAVCPYGAPQVVEDLETYYPDEATPYEQIPMEKRHWTHRIVKGIATKCTFCWHKTGKAIEEGKVDRIGVDPEYTPACALVCPTEAIIIGDLDDPNSRISRLIKEKKAIQLKKEYATRPQAFYVVG